jgi:predicted dehydrogenase
MLRFLAGDIAEVTGCSTNFHGHDGIEDVAVATVRFAGGGLGTLTSVWHDNLTRPSQRHVEVFCERRLVTIEGDDWYGPVHWTNPEGGSHSITGDDLRDATQPMRDTPENPDESFVRAVLDGRQARPDFAEAVEAHRVVEAMYRSAAGGGQPVAIADA